MMISRAAAWRLVSISALVLSLMGCRPGRPIDPDGPEPIPPPVSCGTEVSDPDEMVVGCLVDEGGRPVPRFNVRAGTLAGGGLPEGNEAIDPVDSVLTDDKGRFSFRSLESGEFLIYGEDGPDRHMPIRRVVRQKGDTTAKLGFTTLYENGLLEGILLKENGEPLPSVACVVKDEPYSTSSLLNGRFTMYLPSGRITLLCGVGRSDLLLTGADTVIKAGKTTSVTLVIPTVEEPRPPGPTAISLRYDELTGIVHLSWPPVGSGVAYVLRRTDLSIGSHAYETFSMSDTSHSDVIPWIKNEDGRVRTKEKKILYNLSTAFPNNLATLSHARVDTLISVNPPTFLGPEVSLQILGDKTTFQVGDTALVVGSWQNVYRKNRTLAWTLESDSTALKPVLENPEASGADTLAFPCTEAGKFGILFRVADLSGAADRALEVIEVETAP